MCLQHDDSMCHQLWAPRTLAAPVPSFQCIFHGSSAQRGFELVHSEPNGGQGVSCHDIDQGGPPTAVYDAIPVLNSTDAGMSAIVRGELIVVLFLSRRVRDDER